MKVARWGKEVAEGMERVEGRTSEGVEEGLEKKSETNFRSSLSSLSLPISFLFPSFFSSSGSVRKVSPAYLAGSCLVSVVR